MTGNLINSPVTNGIITAVEKIGPITLEALHVIFPRRDLERRVRSAWGYLKRIILDGEKAVVSAQGEQGLPDEKRQKAYAWLVARCLEAKLKLQDGKVVFPQAALAIRVAPDAPSKEATLLVVPAGFPVPRGARRDDVYLVREEDLRERDLRTAMELGSLTLEAVS
jgi:hypothetical protein